LAPAAVLNSQGTVVVATTGCRQLAATIDAVKPEIAAFVRELVIRQDPEATTVSRWLPKLITSRSQHVPDLWSYGDFELRTSGR
jgi:hypothetical protein